MHSITIELTNSEYLALQHAAISPEEWIENITKERARIAIDEIFNICIKQCLANNIQIPSSKEDIISLAFENGYVKTALDRNAEELSSNV